MPGEENNWPIYIGYGLNFIGLIVNLCLGILHIKSKRQLQHDKFTHNQEMLALKAEIQLITERKKQRQALLDKLHQLHNDTIQAMNKAFCVHGIPDRDHYETARQTLHKFYACFNENEHIFEQDTVQVIDEYNRSINGVVVCFMMAVQNGEKFHGYEHLWPECQGYLKTVKAHLDAKVRI